MFEYVFCALIFSCTHLPQLETQPHNYNLNDNNNNNHISLYSIHKFYFRFKGCFTESAKFAILQVYILFMFYYAQFNSKIALHDTVCFDYFELRK